MNVTTPMDDIQVRSMQPDYSPGLAAAQVSHTLFKLMPRWIMMMIIWVADLPFIVATFLSIELVIRWFTVSSSSWPTTPCTSCCRSNSSYSYCYGCCIWSLSFILLQAYTIEHRCTRKCLIYAIPFHRSIHIAGCYSASIFRFNWSNSFSESECATTYAD